MATKAEATTTTTIDGSAAGAAVAPLTGPALGSSSGGSSSELDIGMAGMSLISGLASSNMGRPPAMVGSSLSSVADHSRHHSAGSLSLPSGEPPLASFRGTPPSPVSPLQRLQYGNVPKPPGLGGVGTAQLPSPIAKGSSGNNTATSSPNLTITPSSSVEGNNELYGGFGKGSTFSGFADARPPAASLDISTGSPWAVGAIGSELNDSYLSGNRGTGTGTGPSDLGGTAVGDHDVLDLHENDPDDGLHGLGALRERAQSSPGPISSNAFGRNDGSPPVRIDVSKHQRDLSPLHSDAGNDGSRHHREREHRDRGLPPDPRRMKMARDVPRHTTRPPLAGGTNASQASHASHASASSFPDTASSFSSAYNELGGTGGTISSFQQQQQKQSTGLSGFGSDSSVGSGRGPSGLSELEKIQGRLTRSASLGTVGTDPSPFGSSAGSHIEPSPYNHPSQQSQQQQRHHSQSVDHHRQQQQQTQSPNSAKFGTISPLTVTSQHSRIPHTISNPDLPHQQHGHHVRSYSGPLQPSIIQGVTEQLDNSGRLGRSYDSTGGGGGGTMHYRSSIDAVDAGGRGVIGGLDRSSHQQMDNQSHHRSSNPTLSRSFSTGDRFGNSTFQSQRGGMDNHGGNNTSRFAQLHRRNSDVPPSGGFGGIMQQQQQQQQQPNPGQSPFHFQDQSGHFDQGGNHHGMGQTIFANQKDTRRTGMAGGDSLSSSGGHRNSSGNPRQLNRRHSDMSLMQHGSSMHPAPPSRVSPCQCRKNDSPVCTKS